MPTNNFLVEITTPQLQDPNFQSKFSEFCQAIHDNFERLISVQYARGERGTSIESHEAYFIKEVNDVWVLTEFGAEFLNKLFNIEDNDSNRFNSGMDEDEVMDLVDQLAPPIVEAHAINWEDWKELSVVIFVDPDSGTAYIGDPYIFIDGRINDLPNYVQMMQGDPENEFTDYSCMYTGSAQAPSTVSDDYSDWEWAGYISQVVPKLYYDDDLHEFCWKVNGQETGITAQGLKGDAGISTATHVCRGTLNGNYLVVDSAERIDYTTTPIRHWDGPNDQVQDNAYNAIKTNDLVICYYQGNDPNDPYYNDPSAWRAFIGRAIRVQDEIRIWVGTTPNDETDPRLDIFYTIWNQACADILNSTGYDGNDTENQCRGLWVKDKTDGTQGVLHMLYVDWSNEGGTAHSRRVLRLSPVATAQGTRDTISPEVHPHDSPDDGYDFEIDYNIKAQRDLHVQGNTTVQNLTVQGVLNQQGQIQTDLNIAGEWIDTVTHQRPDIDKSEFAKCCISNIDDVKTYVTSTKLGMGALGMRELSETIGGDPINTHYDKDDYSSWTHKPIFKAYVGLSFNLHLIIGYLGFGKLIADASIYCRDGQTVTTFDWQNDAQGVIGMTRRQVNDRCSLYNAREYIIPCHMYQELLIGWDGSTPGSHGFQNGDTTVLQKETLIRLTYDAAPINYEGQFIYPRIAFDTWVQINDSTSQWNHTGEYPLSTTPGASAQFDISAIFYQGTVDTSINQAFGLLNGRSVNTKAINQSRVSCLYGVEQNNAAGILYPDIIEFAPLWPYQICEQKTNSNLANYGISDHPVWSDYPDLLIRNPDSQAGIGSRIDQYKEYIYNIAYPRMCAFGAGISSMSAVRGTGLQTNIVRYSTNFNEDLCKPQCYVSFFNKGQVDKDGVPIWTDQSIDIRRVFRLDDMWVFTGNMNIFYRRLNQDNGINNDMQTLIDDDISNIGLNEIDTNDLDRINFSPIGFGQMASQLNTPSTYVRMSNTNKYTNGDDYPHILGHSNLWWMNKGILQNDPDANDWMGTGGIPISNHGVINSFR